MRDTFLLKDRITAIIVAGGEGKRFGSDIPKQFVKLNENPVIYYSIRFFESLNIITDIIIVCHYDWISQLEDWISEWQFRKIYRIVIGGKLRQDSVWEGLKAAADINTKIILIHDAARPFPPEKPVLKAVETAENGLGAILATPAIDTVKEADKNNFVFHTLDRNKIWLAQTPQVFPFQVIFDAFSSAINENKEFTDEGSILENYNHPVKLIPGDKRNIKITQKEDIEIAKIYLSSI